MSERQYNQLSVRLELQADCYAGIWARQSQQAKGWLEEGDIEEGLNAASQIGDDTMQKRSQGTVVPDTFTHGSSKQRAHWFRAGMESRQLSDCDIPWRVITNIEYAMIPIFGWGTAIAIPTLELRFEDRTQLVGKLRDLAKQELGARFGNGHLHEGIVLPERC
jgi:hypothetical protein